MLKCKYFKVSLVLRVQSYSCYYNVSKELLFEGTASCRCTVFLPSLCCFQVSIIILI